MVIGGFRGFFLLFVLFVVGFFLSLLFNGIQRNIFKQLNYFDQTIMNDYETKSGQQNSWHE